MTAPETSTTAVTRTPAVVENSKFLPITEGALGRLVSGTGNGLRVGDEFEVEDYVAAESAEDGVAFYWVSAWGGFCNVAAPADCVVQVKSAAEMRARRPPSLEDVARELDLLGDHGTFESDETEVEGAIVMVYGVTPDGLRLRVKVQVVDVEMVDR